MTLANANAVCDTANVLCDIVQLETIKCMATNFESLLSKFDEFKVRVNDLKPDIVFGTETWLKSDVDDCFIDIPGFKILRSDTTEVRGGVIMIVRDYIDVEMCNEINGMNVKDTLWVWLKSNNNNDSLLGVIYRKGDSSAELNASILEQFEVATRICKGKILINGDFNLPNVDWVNCVINDGENSYSQMFYDKICDLYLTQHVLEPTRQRGNNVPNCLDLVISSSETTVSNVVVSCPIGKADHSVLTWDFHVSVSRKCSEDLYRFNYNKADYGKLCNLLSVIDWSPVINASDVNVAWDIFHEHITNAVKECVPLVKITNKGKINPPWFNVQVNRCIRRKYFAWKRYQENRTYTRYLEYVKERNAANKKVRIAKREYEKKLCKEVKRNPKAFYMYVNSKSQSRSTVTNLKDENGVNVNNDKDIASELNKFFQSVFVDENDKSLIWFNYFMHNIYGEEVAEPFMLAKQLDCPLLDNIFFTPNDVRKLLLAINPNKAMGPDEIHPRVLKESAEVLYFPLYCILRQSIDQCKLPNIWKQANVSPIFKKGDKTSTGNYRPVSLTSQICKLCEKLVRERVVNHLESMICNEQHGFRKGRSCLTNLLVTLTMGGTAVTLTPLQRRSPCSTYNLGQT
jgi:hypothetical protein